MGGASLEEGPIIDDGNVISPAPPPPGPIIAAGNTIPLVGVVGVGTGGAVLAGVVVGGTLTGCFDGLGRGLGGDLVSVPEPLRSSSAFLASSILRASAALLASSALLSSSILFSSSLCLDSSAFLASSAFLSSSALFSSSLLFSSSNLLFSSSLFSCSSLSLCCLLLATSSCHDGAGAADSAVTGGSTLAFEGFGFGFGAGLTGDYNNKNNV